MPRYNVVECEPERTEEPVQDLCVKVMHDKKCNFTGNVEAVTLRGKFKVLTYKGKRTGRKITVYADISPAAVLALAEYVRANDLA